MVILDEPEISLHLQFIEDLAGSIVGAANKVKFLIATHSTRLISSLLRETTDETKVVCSQVCAKKGYTYISTISDIITNKDKYLMRDNEAESFFADALVFVEGHTEIQLLKNRNICKLFPELKKATIYNTTSNDSATKLIIPNYNNPTIPFLVLLDMDKILTYSYGKNKFCKKKLNKAVNPLGNETIKEKENYLYYSSKKEATYYQRKNIEHYLESVIIVDENHFYNGVSTYNDLVNAVKRYCKQYRTIVFKTTVEGAIICNDSLSVFYEWLKYIWGDIKYNDYIARVSKYDILAQVSIARGIFHGKTDYLQKFVDTKVPKDVISIISIYSSGKKVDGWIFDFFDWFFEKYMTNELESNKQIFLSNFPEIYEVVQYICDMI